MEKTVFENWITSEDQEPINLYRVKSIERTIKHGSPVIAFWGEGKECEDWMFDIEAKRDTAYKNIQKLMVNIDYK